MRADFARETFQPTKHYSAVVMQQGRVQLDADWNEQQAIARHRTERGVADLIGPSGAPEGAAGFTLAATPAGDDLLIGAGRYYLDGVLCENDAEVPFTAQPDLRPPGPGLLPTTDGLYLAFLEAWERHVTPVEDPSIREPALGGVDTTTRTKTVWQVRLLAVTDPGGTLTPDTPFPEWDALLAANLVGVPEVGTLAARADAGPPTPDPLCILPAAAAYRRLENQLYRVEVHRGGNRSAARFKWSRDNATVVSALRPTPGGVVVDGQVVVAEDLGRDGVLSFASDPLPAWVELSDDVQELSDQHGELAPVQAVDPATGAITLATAPEVVLDADEHPTVRRWDQRGPEATADGVAMTGDWQPLEDGVSVRFGTGPYRAGDYWLVPARTAIGPEGGRVDWPVAGGDPVPLPPRGTRHRFTRLGAVRRAGGVLSVVPGTDGRRVFPALTTVTRDATSMFTIVVDPDDDLAAAIAGMGSEPDVAVCLRPGLHTVTAPIVIAGRHHVEVVGAGPGSHLVCGQHEAALVFQDCASVRVSDLRVEAGAVAAGGPAGGLDGALTFVDTPAVTVERVTASIAGGPRRAGACVAVRYPTTPGAAHHTVRVSDCDLTVGHRQVGAVVVGASTVRVADNRLRAGNRPADDVLLTSPDYRGSLRRQLLRNLVVGPAGFPMPPNTPGVTRNATVTFAGHVAHFLTDASLVQGSPTNNAWQAAMAARGSGVVNPRTMKRTLRRVVSDVIRTRGTGAGGSASLAASIGTVLSQDTAAGDEGIVVVGNRARDIQVTGNVIDDMVQGVHVAGIAEAVSAARSVSITGNRVRVSLPTGARTERHGVFVGTCDSVIVDDNTIEVTRAPRNAGIPMEGVRIFGFMGRRVVVTHNQTIGCSIGTTFAPLNSPLPPVTTPPLWQVDANLFESATIQVDVPAKRPPTGPPTHGVDNPDAVRALLRGTNFT